MRSSECLTTAEILAVFTEEVAARQGSVTDTFDDGARLFTRSVLPRLEEVGPRDRVPGGVALKARGPEVWLHPYVFRLVCRNGAIAAQATQTRHLVDLDLRTPDEATYLLREAIRACCAEEAFTDAARQMRTAREVEADVTLNLMPFLSRFPHAAARLLPQIMERFLGERDPSRFGLMNAVTSVARDTRDPETRWNLEEFGGGIPAAVPPTVPSRGGAARQRAALVG
jgi:hypothetical protein